MKRWFAAVLLLFAVALPRQAAAEDLLDVALHIRTAVREQLRGCGLVDLDAWDPSLENPQVPAHRAWLRQAQNGYRIAAYDYRESLVGGQQFITKLINGHILGWIGLGSDDYLEVGRSTTGQVAHMSTHHTTEGEQFHFYCRGQRVDRARWQQCVQALFVDALARAVCGTDG